LHVGDRLLNSGGGDQDLIGPANATTVAVSKAAPTLLDTYEARRRPLNIKYVQEQTVANKRRLEERDPVQRAQRFADLRAIADDPQRHKAFLMRAALLARS